MKVLAYVIPKLFQLAGAADQIDAWLNILAPKIEDGNNLGVQVQVDEVNTVSLDEFGSLTLLMLGFPLKSIFEGLIAYIHVLGSKSSHWL